MENSYIITFIGDDRPGLVEQLSGVIEQNGGNWHESQLSQLGGKFAGLVLISLQEGGAQQLETALKTLSASGISVRVTPTGPGANTPSARNITLTLIGPDRQGIVREVSRALATHQVNVIEMDSHEHDLHIAYVSHLSHISSFVLGQTVLEVAEGIEKQQQENKFIDKFSKFI